MPLYEFECRDCGLIREELWFTSGPTPPMCCGRMMRKLLSPSMLDFRGDGWQTPQNGVAPRTKQNGVDNDEDSSYHGY